MGCPSKGHLRPSSLVLITMDSRSVILGSFAGILHHIFFQYPRQRRLPITLLGFLVVEGTLGTIAVSKGDPISETLAFFLTISLVYVLDLPNLSLTRDILGLGSQNRLQHILSPSGNPRQGLALRERLGLLCFASRPVPARYTYPTTSRTW